MLKKLWLWHFKAWFPYDRPDRPSHVKKMFRRSGRFYGNATQTIANDRTTEMNYIAWIELSSNRNIFCDRLGSVSI